MRKAQIVDGVVTNIVLVDPDTIPSWCFDWPEATELAQIGGSYDGTEFFPLPSAVIDRAALKLSFAQLLIGLVAEGWLTSEEARAWRDRVALPVPVQMLISTMPPEQQFAAETRAIAPSEIVRADPLVVALGQLQGKTDAEMDMFFQTYARV